MKHKFKNQGFTLIELLVVIVILGILSTISVGTFRSYFAKARDSERVSAVQNLAMMIKVGTGGDGNCGVYNMTDGTDGTTSTDSTACDPDDVYVLEDLIIENDYKMPKSKSGIKYYYGFKLGDREGDNDFFFAAAAEEEKPQNGSNIQDGSGDTDVFIFVDGTRTGTDGLIGEESTIPACLWVDADQAPDTCTGWFIFEINDDGTLGAEVT